MPGRLRSRAVIVAAALLAGGCSAGAGVGAPTDTTTRPAVTTTSFVAPPLPYPPQKLNPGPKTWRYPATSISGLSEEVTLEVGPPTRFAPGETLGPIPLGSGCHLDSRDLLFPVLVTLENTSKTSVPLAAAFEVPLFSTPSAPGVATVEFEDDDTIPPRCNDIAYSAWEFTAPAIAPGKSELAAFAVFVLANYYGPKTPAGDSGLLVALQLSPMNAIIRPNDRVNNFRPGSLVGPGETAEVADSLNLDGLTPSE